MSIKINIYDVLKCIVYLKEKKNVLFSFSANVNNLSSNYRTKFLHDKTEQTIVIEDVCQNL